GNKMFAGQSGTGPALAVQSNAKPAAAGPPPAAAPRSPAAAPRAPQGSAVVATPAAGSTPAPKPAAAAGTQPRNRLRPAGKDPFTGMVLNGRYRVETKLGQGGFGAVYKGKHDLTGREVALKVLHPDMARDANLVARFRREGAVACNLRDAHTVTTYDFD